MKQFFVITENNVVIDLVITEQGYEDPALKYIHKQHTIHEMPCEYPWKLDLNFTDQYINFLKEDILNLQNTINKLNERVSLIEQLLIEEIKTSPSFGKIKESPDNATIKFNS